LWVLSVLAIAVIACTAMYASNRTAAIAEARKANAFSFEFLPDWWPKQIPIPEWTRSIHSLIIDDATCDLARVAPLHELKQLTFMGSQIDDRTLQSVQLFPNLEYLAILPPTNVTDAGLAELHGCRKLRNLFIISAPITDAGLEHIAGLPIEDLTLACSHVTDAGLRHLARMPLRGVNLDETTIDGSGFRHLAGMRLTELYLSRTHVTDVGAFELRGLPLESLILDQTRITDACLPVLAKLPLKKLSLRWTAVTAGGLEVFRDHPTLTSLWLTAGPRTGETEQLSNSKLTVTLDWNTQPPAAP
jgi:hypothetical protein